MRRGLTARMLAASAVLALVVAAVFAVLLLSIDDLRGSARLSRHSQEVIATANRLERRIIDLQAGQRGFVITGDDRFLEPWRDALATFPAEASTLERLVSDNPVQERRAQEIASAGRSYIDDWTVRVVDVAQDDLAAARDLVASGEGEGRVGALRTRFAAFVREEERLGRERDARAQASAERAVLLGVGGLVGSVLLVLLFAAYLARLIVSPVRQVSAAARRLAGGDLSVSVPARGSGEVGELGEAFNTMARSLQESRDELETQNAELELQSAELEDQQVELSAANDELEAQQAELENALALLGEEKERVEVFYGFGELIAAETNEGSMAPRILRELCDIAQAEVAVLYTIAPGDEERLSLNVALGIDPARLLPVVGPDDGVAGRALAERRPLAVSYPGTGLRIPALGEDVAVCHELQLPLVQGERNVGLVTLARLGDRPFTAAELETIEHLARQTAVRVANGVAYEHARHLASINRAVLDATADGILMIDPEGETLVRNAPLDRMVGGLSGIPTEGTVFERVAAVAELTADPQGYREFMGSLKADPERTASCDVEFVELGLLLHVVTAPVRDGSGALMGRIFTVRDVTAEREAEQLKSELVATVSHELRTPLASILGFAELLVARDLDEETRLRYLDTIYGEAKRLTALVNDFLDLQRIEEGGFTLRLEPFDLAGVLQHQVDLFSGQSSAHTLELVVPDASLDVLGESERIAQVLANLLSNAIKYSPAGGIVRVEAEVVRGAVRVSVTDPGLGIPAGQQQKIFTKFFRVDSSDTRRIGGTGLGLTLCREIVQAHGGHIGFTSEEGEGSTFWFELPAGRRNGSARRRVLVIEDDPVAATLLSEYLDTNGYSVEVAATGEAGLARALADPPALVCLDIVLAGELDGWQVLSRLKESPSTVNVPVVICTGRNGTNRAAALGASDFLTKPFTAGQLREALARLVPADRGSVLVVDDEEPVRRLVVETLAGNGLELREAADGAEALAEVAAQRPDAIVLDLVMPNVDGFAVLERLQEDSETRGIPVVVLTARRLSIKERSELNERAVSLLEKSAYSSTELRELIEKALGEQAAA